MTIKSIKLIPVITSKHCSIYIEFNSQYIKANSMRLAWFKGLFLKAGPRPRPAKESSNEHSKPSHNILSLHAPPSRFWAKKVLHLLSPPTTNLLTCIWLGVRALSFPAMITSLWRTFLLMPSQWTQALSEKEAELCIFKILKVKNNWNRRTFQNQFLLWRVDWNF